jgi:23S rRNA pseudouridine2605 synthase/23S rRNA pseudouridine2604 synthase|tara:strand:- start:236 stop:982 length:747 start_codon:yes stop_codon:yes gene_type:complete
VLRLYTLEPVQERLQKILSAQGICSRRKAEEYIEQGLVKVNGVVAIIGQKADPEIDKIEVDGKVLEDRKEMQYYLMNKPVGIITSNVDNPDHPGKTVRDLLPKELQGTIYPVGRLDKETSGLLLFTNDGVLAYRLTHPSFNHEKEYEVETTDPITDGQLKKMQEGVMIDGEKTKPAVIKKISDKKFTIDLTQGKNRQIRRMCQKVGAPLRYLHRSRIMTLSPQMKEGEFRLLTDIERSALLRSVDLEG